MRARARPAILASLATLAVGCAAVGAAISTGGCGGPRGAAHPAAPEVAAGYPATRWVPEHPAYVLASPTLKQAQRSLRDVIDALGVVVGAGATEASQQLTTLLAIDPLSPDPMGGAGVDLNGGFAVFSEDVAPTFVVHLSAPELTSAFFDRQRERGLITQSVIALGTEVFTAQLLADLKVSWAIAGDWLWVHFTPSFTHDEGAAWFVASFGADHAAHPAWASAWRWAIDAARAGSVRATAAAAPALVGFLDAHEVISSLVGKLPAAVACANLASPIGKIGLAIDGDGKGAAGRVSFELGGAAAAISAAILPTPEGFAQVAEGAPISVQWNLDLVALRSWLSPCLPATRWPQPLLERSGVRAARAVLASFDPDDKSGAGAISLDLVHPRYFAGLLDDIPLRKTLEHERLFGPLAGHALAIPFVASIDYVLTDTLALAGVGAGVLARVVGSGKRVRGPLVAVDLAPGGLSAAAWRAALAAIGLSRSAALVDHMMRWRDGHIAVTVEGTSLVLSAAGSRR